MSDEQDAPAGPTPPVAGWPPESAQRLEKAHALRALGVDPYPTRYERTHGLAEIRAAHDAKTSSSSTRRTSR